MNRQQILDYLDPVYGLTSLPRGVKNAHRALVEKLSDQEIVVFWDDRLRIVVEHIEPLACTVNHPFANLCRQTRELDLPDLVAELQQQKTADNNCLELLLEEFHAEGDDAKQLLCLAALWSRPTPLEDSSTAQVAFLSLLTARCLHVFGHSSNAAAQLEGLLGIEVSHYISRDTLCEHLGRSDLLKLDLALQAAIVHTLADILQHVAERGSGATVVLIEVFLKLQPAAYATYPTTKAALNQEHSPLRCLPIDVSSTLVCILAQALHYSSRSHEAVMLIEAYLGIETTDYRSEETMRDAIWKEVSPLHQTQRHVQASMLTTLSMATRNISSKSNNDAIVLLTMLFRSAPSRLDASGQNKRQGVQPLMYQLEKNSQVFVVGEFCDALRDAGRSSDARLILRNFWRHGSSQLVFEVLRGKVAFNNVANVILTLLSVEDVYSDIALNGCEQGVELVQSIRDEQLLRYSTVADFVRLSRRLWNVIRRVMLIRLERSRRSSTVIEFNNDEHLLLLWTEQFENRLLFERLLRFTPSADDVKNGTCPPPTKEWCFAGPWNESRVDEWMRDFRQQVDPVTNRFTAEELLKTVQAEGIVLRADCINHGETQSVPDTEQSGFGDSHASSQGKQTRLRLVERGPMTLQQLIPKNTIWLRGMFDSQGRLLWWACTSGTDRVRMLARSASRPGAERRLTHANRLFDIGVEREWAKPLSQKLSLPTLKTLSLVTEILSDSETLRECQQDVHETLAEAGQAGRPQVQLLGMDLLAALMEPPEDHDAEEIEFLKDAWRRVSTEFSVDLPPEGDRTAALDNLSAEQLDVLDSELDLSKLWDATGHVFPWSETDVMFTMPGPLMAMPLAWMNIGRTNLFRLAASTSTVCSLSLRDWSDSLRQESNETSQDVLCALWDEPAARSRTIGLPYLNARLKNLSDDITTWSIGDEPRATRQNLVAALNDRRRKYGVVVVGGHGDADRCGVRLAPSLDETRLENFAGDAKAEVRDIVHWCGDGADLSDVNLLILVSCAVGRLNQQGDRDAEGMYVQLLGQGASTVIAAKWPISDIEAAEFATEIVKEYFLAPCKESETDTFARARAFNRARRVVLDRSHDRVTFHQAAAFELYGRG